MRRVHQGAIGESFQKNDEAVSGVMGKAESRTKEALMKSISMEPACEALASGKPAAVKELYIDESQNVMNSSDVPNHGTGQPTSDRDGHHAHRSPLRSESARTDGSLYGCKLEIRPSAQSVNDLGKEGYGKSTLSKARTRGARSENQDYYDQGGNTRGDSAA